MTTELVVVDYQDARQGADLLEVLSAYACDIMGGGQDLPKQVKDNLLLALAQQPGAFSVLAYVNGEPAALANCFEGFSTFACAKLINIHDFAVMAKFRGQQLSQTLLDKIESIAKQRGCCKVTLEVLQGNTTAQNAYRKFGFAGYELDGQMGHALFWQKKLSD